MKKITYAIIALILSLLILSALGCTKSTIVSPDGPSVVVPSEDDKPNTNEDEKDSSGTPYINENGEEDILPEKTPDTQENDDVQYFIPDSPKDFDECSAEFIKNSMMGMSFDDIVILWGDGDMNQINGNEGISAYFITNRDILIHYNTETGEVTDITTIDNQ